MKSYRHRPSYTFAKAGAFFLVVNLVLTISALSLFVRTGWWGCYQTLSYVKSQQLGEPAEVGNFVSGACSLFGSTGVPQISGLIVKHVIDTPNDVPTLQQAENEEVVK